MGLPGEGLALARDTRFEADGGRGLSVNGSGWSLAPAVRYAASWGSHDRVRWDSLLQRSRSDP